MPLFEYHCNACSADFEVIVFGAKPEVVCEKCGSKNATKRLSRFRMGRSSEVDFSESFTMDTSGEVTSRESSGSDCSSCTASSCEGCK